MTILRQVKLLRGLHKQLDFDRGTWKYRVMKTNQPPYHKRLGLRRIVLAMTPEMHERIRECAFIDGRSMQKWIIRTLAKCLKMDVENEMKRL